MKAIIITTPLGNGHNSVAQALSTYLTKQHVENIVLDLYENIQPMLKDIISKGYYLSMKSMTLVKDFASDIYDLNEKRDMTSEYSLNRVQNIMLASKLNKVIDEYNPDLIICTQVYAAQVVDVLKEKGKVSATAVGIITDFTVQSYWEDVEHFEYIVVGSELLSFQLKKRNIQPERVLPFGIPIADKFALQRSKTQACSLLNLSDHTKNVLIMGGGMGFGNIDKYIEEIDKSVLDLQMIVVCGSNKSLYKKLQGKSTRKKMVVLGYINYVDILMDASDCILSKPGGITTSETLAKGLPMIMIDQLPGVEDRNVEFLLNNGAALFVTKTFSIDEALHVLLESSQRQRTIKATIKTLAKPDSTQHLCDFLIDKISYQQHAKLAKGDLQ
ncbi:MGDG synthase family glycosyltransferase [Desulfitobacterium metallireducens]|uniref:Monogalactosyldiacylglycerol synthase n=1 Tax=Desulfitobacterium metallireducens DSM 15288 TaxID=871968 RepID=W0EGK6_9FIRM|nr:glycosyltransferase [Desulfitobacterium metallireducens]AHF08176.1 monogalactosyldiacylglycerol synthase [Desulfitobacterium metallireducens DSM 15288]